jgi:acetyl esterase/lipase
VITLAYGPHPDQVGDLYLPADSNAPLVCLLHGGFWRMPYGRVQRDPLAQAFACLGYAAP